jgi:hypothetical protein
MYLPEYMMTTPTPPPPTPLHTDTHTPSVQFSEKYLHKTLNIVCFPDNVYKKQLTPYVGVNMVNSQSGKQELLIPQQVQVTLFKW